VQKLALAAELHSELAADRAGCLARDGRVAACDLIDALQTGKVTLETLRSDELPDDLRKMSAPKRREHLARMAQVQARLLREASNLDLRRASRVAREQQRNSDSFDGQVLEILRKLSRRQLRF
jgi:hypothetical protein